jgi:chemotaxis-related protein WspD
MDDKRQPSHSVAGAAIDDCWNRIGIRGDASCPRLVDYVDCRNCPVYECAAAMLLDRPLTDIDLMLCHGDAPALPLVPRIGTSATSGDTVDVDSLLVFRLGDEWLALPTRVFHQVTEMRRIHSLPHQRNRALLGIVNIRGALVVCASLGDLLGLEAVAGTPRDSRRAVYQRLLVVTDHGQSTAFPVDEVDGIQRFARVARDAVPATVARAALTYTRAVVRWQGRTIGLLDADLLLETLNRGLT